MWYCLNEGGNSYKGRKEPTLCLPHFRKTPSNASTRSEGGKALASDEPTGQLTRYDFLLQPFKALGNHTFSLCIISREFVQPQGCRFCVIPAHVYDLCSCQKPQDGDGRIYLFSVLDKYQHTVQPIKLGFQPIL